MSYSECFPLGLPTLWWPGQQPTDSKLYSFSTAPDLVPIGDLIASVTVSIAPSGSPGDLQVSELMTFNDLEFDIPWRWPIGMVALPPYYTDPGSTTAYNVGMRLTGGVAGRRYTVQNIVTTFQGNTFTYMIGITTSPVLVNVFSSWPVPPPVNPGFGVPVVLGATVSYGIVGAVSALAYAS